MLAATRVINDWLHSYRIPEAKGPLLLHGSFCPFLMTVVSFVIIDALIEDSHELWNGCWQSKDYIIIYIYTMHTHIRNTFTYVHVLINICIRMHLHQGSPVVSVKIFCPQVSVWRQPHDQSQLVNPNLPEKSDQPGPPRPPLQTNP